LECVRQRLRTPYDALSIPSGVLYQPRSVGMS
jgi:hypothetical protein